MEGEHVLRAKIDMSSPNMLLRDPVMYRIIHMSHQRTNKDWCVYPMYDWAHGQSDLLKRYPTRCAPWSLSSTGSFMSGSSML